MVNQCLQKMYQILYQLSIIVQVAAKCKLALCKMQVNALSQQGYQVLFHSF